MSKPSTLPIWGDTSTNIIVPPSGSYHPGFATGAQVPSGWINWFFNLVYQWLVWVNTLDTAPTKVVPTYAGGISGANTGYESLNWRQAVDGTVYVRGAVTGAITTGTNLTSTAMPLPTKRVLASAVALKGAAYYPCTVELSLTGILAVNHFIGAGADEIDINFSYNVNN